MVLLGMRQGQGGAGGSDHEEHEETFLGALNKVYDVISSDIPITTIKTKRPTLKIIKRSVRLN